MTRSPNNERSPRSSQESQSSCRLPSIPAHFPPKRPRDFRSPTPTLLPTISKNNSSKDGPSGWLEEKQKAALRTQLKYSQMATAPNMKPVTLPQLIPRAPATVPDGSTEWLADKVVKDMQVEQRIRNGNLRSTALAEISAHANSNNFPDEIVDYHGHVASQVALKVRNSVSPTAKLCADNPTCFPHYNMQVRDEVAQKVLKGIKREISSPSPTWSRDDHSKEVKLGGEYSEVEKSGKKGKEKKKKKSKK